MAGDVWAPRVPFRRQGRTSSINRLQHHLKHRQIKRPWLNPNQLSSPWLTKNYWIRMKSREKNCWEIRWLNQTSNWMCQPSLVSPMNTRTNAESGYSSRPRTPCNLAPTILTSGSWSLRRGRGGRILPWAGVQPETLCQTCGSRSPRQKMQLASVRKTTGHTLLRSPESGETLANRMQPTFLGTGEPELEPNKEYQRGHDRSWR